MSTMLGKGANCALQDILTLSDSLRSPSVSSQYVRRLALHKSVGQNVNRRLRERQRSAFVHSMVYFGDNKIKEVCRDHGLKKALGWIQDPKQKIAKR